MNKRIFYMAVLYIGIGSCSSEDAAMYDIAIPNQPTLHIEAFSPQLASPTNENQKLTFGEFLYRRFLREECQHKFVRYPIAAGSTHIKTKTDWELELFYPDKDYFIIITKDSLDSFEQIPRGDTLQVTEFTANNSYAKEFTFMYEDTAWFLTKISFVDIQEIDDLSFVNFLSAFSISSAFQKKHIAYPFISKYLNYDDYSELTDSLYAWNWKELDFRGSYLLLNDGTDNNFRTYHVAGLNNGITITYLFEKVGGNWKLLQSEDYSN